MAKFIYGLQQSLDGYVDHLRLGRPSTALFKHFLDHVRELAAIVYGRRTYEVMRYWDEDLPDWDAEEHNFAAVWRSKPKWVVSRSLTSVGPNATLIQDDVESALRALKARFAEDVDVAGPELAHGCTSLGLVDEYQLYLRPVVLGRGAPFFLGPRPPLRLISSREIGEAVQLTYVPV